MKFLNRQYLVRDAGNPKVAEQKMLRRVDLGGVAEFPENYQNFLLKIACFLTSPHAMNLRRRKARYGSKKFRNCLVSKTVFRFKISLKLIELLRIITVHIF